MQQLPAGNYHLNAHHVQGCTFDTLLTLPEPIRPNIRFQNPLLVISLGDSLLLEPQSNFQIDSFSWNKNLSELTPVVKPVQTTL